MGRPSIYRKHIGTCPLSPGHRPLPVTVFRDSRGRDLFFIADSFLFGATCAVYGFDRVVRSLRFLLVRYQHIIAGSFYDVFP